MSTTTMKAQDRRDLEKFTKFLVYKSMQIIVQSRLGEKVETRSKAASSGADWFNLNIRDIADVTSEIKRVLAGQVLSNGQAVCLEISLKTAESETMVLEQWSLSMNQPSDPNTRISYTIYNRMGTLLKSLFCVTRVIPAYRLSRKQGPETYVICYRLYLGEPQVNSLGTGCGVLRIGAVATPVGTISLNVAYRTKLMMSPQNSRELTYNCQDDYFKQEASPKPCYRGFRRESRSSVSDDPIGEDNPDYCSASFSTSPSDPALAYAVNNRQLDDKQMQCASKTTNVSDLHRVGAFTPLRPPPKPDDIDDIPFMSLLNPVEVEASNASEQPTVDQVMKSEHSEVPPSNNTDFVMIELKTPFAEPEANTDLGKFYRDCQTAPPLVMFEEQSDIEHTLNGIANQLTVFESCTPDIDDFVNSLQIAD